MGSLVAGVSLAALVAQATAANGVELEDREPGVALTLSVPSTTVAADAAAFFCSRVSEAWASRCNEPAGPESVSFTLRLTWLDDRRNRLNPGVIRNLSSRFTPGTCRICGASSTVIDAGASVVIFSTTVMELWTVSIFG